MGATWFFLFCAHLELASADSGAYGAFGFSYTPERASQAMLLNGIVERETKGHVDLKPSISTVSTGLGPM